MLEVQQAKANIQTGSQEELQTQLEQAQVQLKQSEDKFAQKAALDVEMQTARQRQFEARSENPKLKAEMDELKERIDQLSQVEDAVCPLCGQPLSPDDRQALLDQLKSPGQRYGRQVSRNRASWKLPIVWSMIWRNALPVWVLSKGRSRQIRRVTQLGSRLEQIVRSGGMGTTGCPAWRD
jgi:DNA repair exonuclease SbcCD ATPase subunit